MMEISDGLQKEIESDLGLDKAYEKGRSITVRRCWHFSTDGNKVDCIFEDEEDFIAGMNRIHVVVRNYRVIILAFSLMDTHLHFILWGDVRECDKFMHEYVRRTSMHIARRHGENKKLENLPIHHQTITDDYYLKVALCYVIKNAPVGGLPFNAIDYPWSSGPLYFRPGSTWTSPVWMQDSRMRSVDERWKRYELLTRADLSSEVRMVGRLIFPGEYVAVGIVEKIFRSCRGYNYFMCISKEESVESRGGTLSRLSIPMQEMRQHKRELCMEFFGTMSSKSLDTTKRIRLAKALKSRFNSSDKQILRLCGLVWDECRGLI